MIDAVAMAAEGYGLATLWSGEHVVMVDRSRSRYPYSDDGQIAVPSVADWIEPLIGLSFAAAATSNIGIATGVLLLPEHNPVLLAKQAATSRSPCANRVAVTWRCSQSWGSTNWYSSRVRPTTPPRRRIGWVGALADHWMSEVR
ncbi:MAG: putative F420-dependent oxidoreductase, Rv2161c family [Mycobacterium sp.]|nr:putative F420-dependent oxidoreductase, Rv2161c family [Mycobacterium sp.]